MNLVVGDDQGMCLIPMIRSKASGLNDLVVISANCRLLVSVQLI